MSPQQEQEQPQGGDDEARAAASREERLQAFGLALTKHRDEWIAARTASGIERQWIEDLDQYHGRDPHAVAERDDIPAVGAAAVKRDTNNQARSRVIVNATKPKVRSTIARISNMYFPVDEKNFGVNPTPVPELNEQLASPVRITHGGQPMLRDDGGQVTAADLAAQVLAEAKKRAEAMEREIADQLSECQYNAAGRKVIADAVKLGTGIMKGPIVRGCVERQWQPVQGADELGQPLTVHEMMITERHKPASMRVSCWDVYPDPCCGENIHDGSGVWERARLTKRRLRELARAPGYFKDKIAAVLAEEPHVSVTFDAYEQTLMRRAGLDTAAKETRYEVWTYTGEVRREDLAVAGVELPLEAELETLAGVVVVVNGRVIKAHLNPLESGDLPYDFVRFSRVEGSPWGESLSRDMRTGQKILTAAWRQTMDNAGATVGPIVVIKRGQVEPADGLMEVRGRKLFYASDETEDVREAFAVFQIDSRIGELMNLIKFTNESLDETSNVPMLTQGERGSAPDTVGGMTLLMNLANEFIKGIAKGLDDELTTPHIRRYYDFNMQYSPKAELKGDYQVDARGSSSLVVRDLQNQAILQMLALANNPAWAAGLKKWGVLRKAFAANHLSPDDFVEPDDDVIAERERALAQASAPADSAIEVEKMRSQARMAELQYQREADLEKIRAQRDIAVLEYAKQMRMNEDKLKAMLADSAMRERNKRELFAAEQQLKLSPRNPSGEGI